MLLTLRKNKDLHQILLSSGKNIGTNIIKISVHSKGHPTENIII